MPDDDFKDSLFHLIGRQQAKQERVRRTGEFEGRHYLDWVETVKELKRGKRYAEAERILIGLVAAAERQARAEELVAPPWYQDQLDLVRRQLERENARAEGRSARRTRVQRPKVTASKRLYHDGAGSLMLEIRYRGLDEDTPAIASLVAETLGPTWATEWELENTREDGENVACTLRRRRVSS